MVELSRKKLDPPQIAPDPPQIAKIKKEFTIQKSKNILQEIILLQSVIRRMENLKMNGKTGIIKELRVILAGLESKQ